MSDWKFDHHEVLEDSDGYWFHVVNRFESIDTGEQIYRLYDATHTADKKLSVEYVESDFESCEWSTTTKPAHEHGYRVNGVLCEPARVERYLGNGCVSDWDCPNCGEDTTDNADVVIDLENREINTVTIRCGACDQTTEVDSE